MNTRTRTRRPRLSGRIPMLPLLLLAAAAGLVPVADAALQQEPDPVDETRELLRQWVDTRTVIDTEKADWALEEEMLSSQIELVELELERLRGSIDEARAALEAAGSESAELAARDAEYAATEAAMTEVVGALETRVKELLPRLPQGLRDDVALYAQRLPDDPADTAFGVGERFMSVVGLLNAVNKHHRDLHVTNERRALPDGDTKEVATLYLGISQAWYASADGRSGGYGRPAADGWRWVAANDYAPEILEAIRIQQNESPARYVRLPLTLD